MTVYQIRHLKYKCLIYIFIFVWLDNNLEKSSKMDNFSRLLYNLGMLVERACYLTKIKELLKENPVVALIGPRQVGKTTLARSLIKPNDLVTFFDLENPTHLARLDDPMLTLQSLKGLVIIDEIQHCPDLFKILRVLADRPQLPCRFLVLGSASPTLLKQSSESLAGRIAYLEIKGFNLQEVGLEQIEKLWVRGAFPRSFLADSDLISKNWRNDFIRTFLERDLPQLGIRIPTIALRRFWMMLAHYHGQIWNAAEFSRAFGISTKLVRQYLDILTSTFVIDQLSPWWENISKRQIKAPKIYLSDTGLLHTLLGINVQEDLENHPKVGASWEGFAMNAIISRLGAQREETYFWGTHAGAELDLLVIRGNIRLGFEFKRTVMPKPTRSIYTSIADLNLSHAYIVHAGDDTYPFTDDITALSIKRILSDLEPLRG